MSLFSVSVDALRNMELEGFTLEEIQMSLYGEYGIKASMGAIKKRMMDAASDKKSRKKTGKTRRGRCAIQSINYYSCLTHAFAH